MPAGVTVSGCIAGDVLAIEAGGSRRVWRVDSAGCGTPVLAEVGRLSLDVVSIAFAHGRLFAIDWGSVFYELDTATFQVIGTGTDLYPSGDTQIGGLAFNGTDTWYLTNGRSSNLISLADPPADAGWHIVGNTGLNFRNSGLEMVGNQLWGALQVQDANNTLVVGNFNLQNGAFAQVWQVTTGLMDSVGFVAFQLPSISRGDTNCDGAVNLLDVPSFVLALLSAPDYVAAFPTCAYLNADVSEDCRVNGDDIQPFVNRLLGH